MNRFQRVIEILDRAVGGPGAFVGVHGAFWQNITRNDFVARKVLGLPLITVGDGAGSNLVKALKGQLPFGADLPDAPPEPPSAACRQALSRCRRPRSPS